MSRTAAPAHSSTSSSSLLPKMNGKLPSARIAVVCAVAFFTGMLLGHWNPLFNPNCGFDSGSDSDLVTATLTTQSLSSSSSSSPSSGLIAVEAPLHDVANCGVGLFDQVKTFVLFVGYPRSGHSLVGTLLDAHANLVISDERNVLIRDELFNSTSVDVLFRSIVTHSLFKWSGFAADVGQRVHAQDGVVRYNYSVPTLWQGKFSCLRVIGDKKGSTIPLLMQRDQTDEILRKLKLIRDNGYRIKFFHVIRNPFDNVATMASQKLDWHSTHAKEHIDAKEKAAPWSENGPVLIKKYEFYRDLHENINKFLKEHVDKSDVITIYDPDLTKDPRTEITRWCKFLDVRCSRQYLDGCAKGVYPHTYHSRDKFEWSSDMVANMSSWMQSMPLLRRFSFTSE